MPDKNDSLENCPDDKPYFNNAECIECILPAYFNFDTFKCEVCRETQKFSEVAKKCVEEKFLETQYKSNLNDAKNYHGEAPEISKDYVSIVECPKDNPFFNGEICLKCELPNYFNFDKMKCQSCPKGEIFDIG